jgi:hypothetical protein
MTGHDAILLEEAKAGQILVTAANGVEGFHRPVSVRPTAKNRTQSDAPGGAGNCKNPSIMRNVVDLAGIFVYKFKLNNQRRC